MSQTILDTKQYIVPTYPNRGVTFVSGEGNSLVSDTGEKYLDMMTGFGVNIFGHSHPVITQALTAQISNLVALHGSFANPNRVQAAKRLSGLLNNKYQVYFGNSGTEATEAAIKFASVITNRHQFVSFSSAYHGKSLAALSLNGSKKYTDPFEQLLKPASLVAYNQTAEVKKIISDQVAAVFVEPIQGEGGINPSDPAFLEQIRTHTKQTGSLMIVDEIQTGLGRTGKMFGFQVVDIEPDIITLAKGLGGGVPVSATLVHKKHVPKIAKGIQTSTTGGSPLACAGINAVLDLLTPEVIDHVKDLGEYFIQQLTSKLEGNSKLVEIRGRGLMLGVELNIDINPVLKALQDNKIIAGPAGDNVIRFLPPYTINKSEIDRTIKTIKTILSFQ